MKNTININGLSFKANDTNHAKSIIKMMKTITWTDKVIGIPGLPPYEHSFYKIFLIVKNKIWRCEQNIQAFKLNYFDNYLANCTNIVEGTIEDLIPYKHMEDRPGLNFMMNYFQEVEKQTRINELKEQFGGNCNLLLLTKMADGSHRLDINACND